MTVVPIEGVILTKLQTHQDHRGNFTELFRAYNLPNVEFKQWNAVNSHANVLRGVHVHLKHWDYLTVLRGRVLFGLKDLRKGSPTENVGCFVELDESNYQTILIPPGVAHGFYFLEPSLHLYAVSEYWDTEDELGFHYADKDADLLFPCKNPLLSPRDIHLPSFKSILPLMPHYQA
jgi:dTDP-4-dehydrorhamnose 3,5-epimerase